jgi:Flp pilus assembly protein TadD
MGRKIILAAAVLIVVSIALATPRFNYVGAWGKPAAAPDAPQPTANSIASVFGAPFRALGSLFRGGKKKKAASKISEKDIAKFEGTEVSRVNDANTPQVAPANQQPIEQPIEQASVPDRIRRGRELLNAGRLNDAIAELTAATSLDPKSGEAHMLLGIAFDRKGLGARAREAFETAAHAPDDQAMHLNNLGFLLYRQGEYSDAIKHLKRAAKLNPAENKIWNNLVLVQLAAEKYDDAYKSSVPVLGEYGSRLKIARSLEWRGRTKDAIKQLEKARALQPASTEALGELVKLYTVTGQEEKAQIARESLASLRAVATAPAPK